MPFLFVTTRACHVPHATHSSSVLTEISNICCEVPIMKPLVTKFLFSLLSLLSLPPKPPAISFPAPYSQTLNIFSPVNIGHRGLHPYTKFNNTKNYISVNFGITLRGIPTFGPDGNRQHL